MKYLILLFALLLGGCNAFAPKEDRSDYAAYAAAITAARANPPKAFDLECPPAGCVFTRLTAYQTGGAHNDIAPPAPPPKPEHAAVGVIREVKETILGIAPFAMPVLLVNGMMKQTGKMFEAVASRPPSNSTVTNNTLTGNGSAMNGGTASTVRTRTTDSHDSTVTTTTSNSNNINRNCQSGTVTGTTTPTGGAANC